MRPKFCSREFGPSRIAHTCYAFVAIGFALLSIGTVDLCAREGSKEWIVFQDCRSIPNPANDGDSFHVSVGHREYLFRLYMVDAPETDEMVPRRLVDQARYFGITVRQAIEVGRAAKEFTRQKLSEPFTVFTHLSDAMGQSRLERFYAYVQTKDGDLGEQLVRNGLAQIYGFRAAPPGLTSVRLESDKLQRLENEAKRERIGAWRVSANPSAPSDALAPVPSFTAQFPIPPNRTPNPNQHGRQLFLCGSVDVDLAEPTVFFATVLLPIGRSIWWNWKLRSERGHRSQSIRWR